MEVISISIDLESFAFCCVIIIQVRCVLKKLGKTFHSVRQLARHSSCQSCSVFSAQGTGARVLFWRDMCPVYCIGHVSTEHNRSHNILLKINGHSFVQNLMLEGCSLSMHLHGLAYNHPNQHISDFQHQFGWQIIHVVHVRYHSGWNLILQIGNSTKLSVASIYHFSVGFHFYDSSKDSITFFRTSRID